MHGRPAAGPSIAISFFLVAIACSFAGLCYAELASMIPIAGSAYTYSYATLGEIFAWIIGWDLILEYVVSNVAVAVGFAGYTKAQLAALASTCRTNGRVRCGPAAMDRLLFQYARIPHCFHSHAAAGARRKGIGWRPTTSWSMVKIGAILTFLVVGAMLVKPLTGLPSRPLASPESSPAAPSFSLPTSDSIRSRPPPRSRAIRKKICPSASSCR